MFVLVLLSDCVPFDILKKFKEENTKFIIAANSSASELLKKTGVEIEIKIPECYDFLKSLAYVNTKIIRYEYDKVCSFKFVSVFGPDYSNNSGITYKFLKEMSTMTFNTDVWISSEKEKFRPSHSFFCLTSAFRLIAQAYKYNLGFYNQPKFTSSVDRIKFIAFLSQTSCLLKRVQI